MIGDPALQDAEEQRPPLVRGPVGVTPHQGEHGVLHDVQRLIPIRNGEPGHVVGPLLHLRQAVRVCKDEDRIGTYTENEVEANYREDGKLLVAEWSRVKHKRDREGEEDHKEREYGK